MLFVALWVNVWARSVHVDRASIDRFLSQAYAVATAPGNPQGFFTHEEVGAALGLDESVAHRIASYLEDRGLLIRVADEGLFVLSARGLDVAMDGHTTAPAAPETRQQQIIVGRDVVNSTLQQAASCAQQSASIIAKNQSALKKHLEELLQGVLKSKLDPAGKAEATASIKTMQAQLESPKPNATVMQQAWSTVRRVLEGAAASLTAAGMLALLPKISKLVGG